MFGPLDGRTIARSQDYVTKHAKRKKKDDDDADAGRGDTGFSMGMYA